jgi:murein DD-endopeptidase MepM/ murein hydrolase activator NlpD
MEVKIVNIKKLFPKKKLSKQALLEFLDKRGFYIVLILCIAIVGVTAVFLTTRNFGTPGNNYGADNLISDEPSSDVAKNTQHKLDDSKKAQSSIKSSENDKNVGASTNTGDKTKVGDSDKSPSKASDKQSTGSQPKDTNTGNQPTTTQKFIKPVLGTVSFDYAGDKLVYSKTLEDWRTHSGIDLAVDRGTSVKAVADGVISAVINDPRFGITVIIDHGNGLKTVYSNLASDDAVTPNQIVKKGAVIGSVGNTASFESAEKPHLHFEVLKNNLPVNPALYLPK